MNVVPLPRAFHSSRFLFEEAAPAEDKKEEQAEGASLDDQLASIKKQLESSEKEVVLSFVVHSVAEGPQG